MQVDILLYWLGFWSESLFQVWINWTCFSVMSLVNVQKTLKFWSLECDNQHHWIIVMAKWSTINILRQDSLLPKITCDLKMNEFILIWIFLTVFFKMFYFPLGDEFMAFSFHFIINVIIQFFIIDANQNVVWFMKREIKMIIIFL